MKAGSWVSFCYLLLFIFSFISFSFVIDGFVAATKKLNIPIFFLSRCLTVHLWLCCLYSFSCPLSFFFAVFVLFNFSVFISLYHPSQAAEQLIKVRGKDFRHEKTKKKRGSYKGGPISTSCNSFKFDD